MTAAVNRCLHVKNKADAVRVYSYQSTHGDDESNTLEDEVDEVRWESGRIQYVFTILNFIGFRRR